MRGKPGQLFSMLIHPDRSLEQGNYEQRRVWEYRVDRLQVDRVVVSPLEDINQNTSWGQQRVHGPNPFLKGCN